MRVIKKMYLWDDELVIVHNCYVGGQMADGTKCWYFDEMDEDGIYTAVRNKESNKLILVRQ